MSTILAKQAKGFTIVELLIASSIFTLVLILITVGVIQFTKQYYRGIISSKTQDTARAIIDDVSRAIQLNTGQVSELTINGAPKSSTNPIRGYCIGEAKRYSFALNKQVVDGSPGANQSRYGLISDTTTGCSGNTEAVNVTENSYAPGSGARELLGLNMRLSNLTIKDLTGGLYQISVRVVYGDNDLLCSPSIECSPDASFPAGATDLSCKISAGSEFCAVSALTTTVQKRVN